jgi:hypothetical protein
LGSKVELLKTLSLSLSERLGFASRSSAASPMLDERDPLGVTKGD